MKGILEFNLPEDGEEFDTARNAAKYRAALWEISQLVFRPARKHGYSDPRIQELLERADTLTTTAGTPDFAYEGGVGTELVSKLEEIFYQILRDEGIEI